MVRSILACGALCLVAVLPVVAQDVADSGTPGANVGSLLGRPFVVEVTCATFKSIDEPTAKALSSEGDLRAVVERLDAAGLVTAIERTSINVVDNGRKVMVHAGAVAPNLQSRTANAFGGNRNVAAYSQVNIGTMVQLAMSPMEPGGSRMVIDLSYESSRLLPSTEPSQPGTTATRKVDATIMINVGETVIAHTFAAEQATILLVTLGDRHRVYPLTERPPQVAPASQVDAGDSTEPTDVNRRQSVVIPSSVKVTESPAEIEAPSVTRFRSLQLPEGSDAADARERFAKMIFERADRDGDSKISFDEAKDIGVLFGRFHELDKNGDESLASDEIINGLLGGQNDESDEEKR